MRKRTYPEELRDLADLLQQDEPGNAREVVLELLKVCILITAEHSDSVPPRTRRRKSRRKS